MSIPLSCPSCRDQMVEVDDDGVRVDVCSSCSGLWLDAGELEQKGGKLSAESRGPGERICPLCVRPMEVLDAGLVEIDRCPICRGLFLDHGELELLLRVRRIGPQAAIAAAAFAPPPPAPDEPQATDAPHEVEEPAPPKPRATFWCDFCRKPTPIEKQVIGELVTVCPACAERHDIRHDPKARRRSEQAREDEKRGSWFIDEKSGRAVGFGFLGGLLASLFNASASDHDGML